MITINKKTLIWSAAVVIVAVFAFILFANKKSEKTITESPSPSLSISLSPKPSSTISSNPKASKTPIPTGDGKTTFIDQAVPWSLLLSDASCQLKGEIKFLNANTYDNQDALFIYSGIDHPARNIKWTVTPAEANLDIGPNIFSKMPLPNGQALLGIFPKGNLAGKRYELTAMIEYGRLVDENGKFVTAGGNVKIFKKQCDGKTVIVLP